MKVPFVNRSLVFLAACLAWNFALPTSPAAEGEEGRASPLGELPLIFVENQGQWDDAARFVARKGPLTARFEAGALVLAQRDGSGGEVVRLAFEGASSTAWIEGEDPIRGVHNFLVGEPSSWRTHVPGYGSLVYRGLYEGIDLRLRDRDGRLEYDVLLARAADLERVVVRCDGVYCIEVDAAGNLVLTTALGELVQAPPLTWQVLAGGEERPVECSYRRIDAQRYGFEALDSEPDLPLVVDPGLQWSTFLGGSVLDYVRDVWIAPDGDVMACGPTYSNNFPTTPGAYSASNSGNFDGFVARMDPTLTGAAQLVYATLFGGADDEWTNSVSVDEQGVITVVGGTYSTDFPTTDGAYQTVHMSAPSYNDVFVCQFDPSNTGPAQLVYSTLIGGSHYDGPDDHHVDGAGVVTLVGRTRSLDFPTTSGVFGPTYGGGLRDIFVCRLDPSQAVPGNQLLYSSFLGGDGDDHNNAWGHLAVDDQGLITVAGRTNSTNFPVKPNPGAYQPALAGGIDGYVSRIDPSLTGSAQLIASTYIGGSLNDSLQAVSVDVGGVVTVGGWTFSTNYPTTPTAFQPTHKGGGFEDTFVSRLDSGLTTLLASTFLGTAGWDYLTRLDASGSGLVTVVGNEISKNFPTTPGAYMTAKPGSFDIYLCRFDPDLEDLLYSTYLGGSNDGTLDAGYALAVDQELAAVVGGRTSCSTFPTTPGAYRRTWIPVVDGFLAKLDMMPTGADPFGASTPGCHGPLAIGVSSWPQQGNQEFDLLCSNAPASALGFAIVTAAGWSTPIQILGVDLWVNPVPVHFIVPGTSDAQGYSEVDLPIPASVKIGAQVYAQFLWPDSCGTAGFAASNALRLTVQ